MPNYPPPEKTIINHFHDCLNSVVENRACYVYDPVSDMTRNRKLPMDETMRLVFNMSSLDNRAEIHSWFTTADPPTDSALIQQRKKIMPEAFMRIFSQLCLPFEGLYQKQNGRRIGAFDGTEIRYYPDPGDPDAFIRADHRCIQGSIHMDALYDTINHIFVDTVFSYGSKMNELRSLELLLEEGRVPEDMIILMDRLYESYELIACFIERRRDFVIRVRDLEKGGFLNSYPAEQEEFDTDFHFHLSRLSSKAAKADPLYKWIPNVVKLKYLKPEDDFYDLKFRMIRIKALSPKGEPVFLCFATSLDRQQYPPEWFEENYPLRWNEEKGFHQLKHPIHMIAFHSRKRDLILQEIFAALIIHNLVSLLSLLIENHVTQAYEWHVDFSTAVIDLRMCLCGRFSPEVLLLRMKKCLVPYRPGRSAPRKVKGQGPQSFCCK